MWSPGRYVCGWQVSTRHYTKCSDRDSRRRRAAYAEQPARAQQAGQTRPRGRRERSSIGTAMAVVHRRSRRAARPRRSRRLASDPRGERQEERDELGQRVRQQRRAAAACGRRLELRGERRGAAAEDVAPGCTSENSVAPATKHDRERAGLRRARARQTPRWRSACAGSELPAMKPATQASACSASTSELRKSTWPTAPRSAGSLIAGDARSRCGSGVTRCAIDPDGGQQRDRDRERRRAPTGARRGPARAFQRRSVGARVVHALDEGELAERSSSIASARGGAALEPTRRPERTRRGAAAQRGHEPGRLERDPPRHLRRRPAGGRGRRSAPRRRRQPAHERAVGQLDLEGVAVRADASGGRSRAAPPRGST